MLGSSLVFIRTSNMQIYLKVENSLDIHDTVNSQQFADMSVCYSKSISCNTDWVFDLFVAFIIGGSLESP